MRSRRIHKGIGLAFDNHYSTQFSAESIQKILHCVGVSPITWCFNIQVDIQVDVRTQLSLFV